MTNDEKKNQTMENLIMFCSALGWDMAVPDQDYGGGGVIFGMPDYVEQILETLPEGIRHHRYHPPPEKDTLQ